MSARQRKRLEGQLKSFEDELANDSSSLEHEESSGDDAGLAVKSSAFTGFESSDEESNSSGESGTSSSVEDEEESVSASKPQKLALDRGKSADDLDELAILEEAIAENKIINEKNARQCRNLEKYASLFDFDGCAFDYDVVVSRRFGKFASVLAGEESSGGMELKESKGIRATQTQIFGHKEAWPKPPSFSAGGLGQALRITAGILSKKA